MALFGSSPAPVTTKPVQRIGSLPTAPAPTTVGLGTPPPTPPAGVLADTSSAILSAQQAAARQKKLAAAGQPLVGGTSTAPLAAPILQPKTLLGR